MTADHPTPATVQSARTALSSARAAQAAARAARRVPAWHPPAAGLLYAAGFTGLSLVADQDPPSVALMVASLACLLGFFAVFFANVTAGGVLLRPTRTPRERWLRHISFVVCTALAVATAFLIDPPAALAVFGVTSGAAFWLQLHRDRTRRTT
ncbi:hypothetical protein ACVNF4_15815 [Streptomyces sp. S6]